MEGSAGGFKFLGNGCELEPITLVVVVSVKVSP
jgi:hypothetical protein